MKVRITPNVDPNSTFACHKLREGYIYIIVNNSSTLNNTALGVGKMIAVHRDRVYDLDGSCYVKENLLGVVFKEVKKIESITFE